MSNSEELTLKLRAVREGMAEAIAEVKSLEAEVGKGSETTQRSTQTTLAHSAAQTTLANTLGVSRGQAGFLVRELASAAGVSGTLLTAVNALTSGIGPLGIAIAAIGIVTNLIKTHFDDMAAAAEKARVAIVRLAEAKSNPALATKFTNEDAQNKVTEDIKKVSAAIQAAEAEVAAYGNTIGQEAKDNAAKHIKPLRDELDRLIATAHVLAGTDLITSDTIGKMDTAKSHLETTADLVRDITTEFNKSRDAAYAAASAYAAAVPGSDFEAQIHPLSAAETSRVNNESSLVPYRNQMAEQGKAEAKAYAEAMAAELKAQHDHLLGIVDSMLQVSEVTSQDLKDTAAGKYKDKPDENLRRLRLYPEIDSSIFKMLPAQIQGELRDAFAQGGGAYKLKIDDLIQKGEDFSDPRLWDVAGMVAGLKQAVATEQNKAKLAEMIVSQSGLDKNNATVQAQVGKLTGQDQLGVGGMLDGAKQMLDKFKPSANLLNAFNADKEQITNSGRVMMRFVIDGLRAELDESVGDITNAFARNLANFGDARWVRQAKTYGVTP